MARMKLNAQRQTVGVSPGPCLFGIRKVDKVRRCCTVSAHAGLSAALGLKPGT